MNGFEWTNATKNEKDEKIIYFMARWIYCDIPCAIWMKLKKREEKIYVSRFDCFLL